MQDIIFKTIFKRGKKGAKGDAGISYDLPTNSIIGYDGNTAPTGYVITTDPTGGADIPAIEFLLQGQALGNDTMEIVDYSYNMTKGSNCDDYLSYDGEYFTVLQDFTALIIPWTYNYLTAGSSYSEGELYINNQLAQSWNVAYTGERYYRGKPLVTELHANDTIYGFTPSSAGYPQQNIKIYKIKDTDTMDMLQDIFTYFNDIGNVEGRASE